MQFTGKLEPTDDSPRKDPLLEALDKTLEESRRLRRGELDEDAPAPPLAPRSVQISP